MQDDGCVFGTSLSGSGSLQEGRRVYPNLCPPSVPSKQKKGGGSGCGGLSVLEESHVVSESGQLLLIWNQRDGGRICRERGERRGGGEVESEGIPHCAKCYRSSNISPVLARRVNPTCSNSDRLSTPLVSSQPHCRHLTSLPLPRPV